MYGFTQVIYLFAQKLLPETVDHELPCRLFCFPHAGGGTAMFYRWRRFLPAGVALAPMRLPGREDRLAEPPYTSLTHLAGDAATAIQNTPPSKYVLLGHSLGGYVAFEVARRLIDAGYPSPSVLIVAACGGPKLGQAKNPIGQLVDEQFIEEVSRRYDGIPTAVRDNPELLAVVLPALRADIQMIESYEYTNTKPLAANILALGGTDDPGVPVHRLNDWRLQTSAEFTMRLFRGDHFFLHPPARRDASTGRDTPPAALQCVMSHLSHIEPED